MKLLSIGAAAVPTAALVASLVPAPSLTVTPSLPADEALLKCKLPAGWTQLDQRYIVDGEFRKPPAFGTVRIDGGFQFVDLQVATEDILRMAVVCWDTEKHVLQRTTGEPVLYLTTKPFMAMVHEDLERIAAAQDAFHKKNSRYAAHLAELDVAPQAAAVNYTLSHRDGGWEAAAASSMVIETCHVFAGSIEPSRDGLEQRTPACFLRPEFDRPAGASPAGPVQSDPRTGGLPRG